MSAIEFRELLKSMPFHPLRIHLSNGATHEVRHPELVIVQRTTIWLHVVTQELPKNVAAKWWIISLLHIVQIEFLSPASRSSSN